MQATIGRSTRSMKPGNGRSPKVRLRSSDALQNSAIRKTAKPLASRQKRVITPLLPPSAGRRFPREQQNLPCSKADLCQQDPEKFSRIKLKVGHYRTL